MIYKGKIETMTSFTIDNLPYGVISTEDNLSKRCAVAFQQYAIDLDLLYRHDFFASIPDLNVNVFANVSVFRHALLEKSTGEIGVNAAQHNWNDFAVLPLDLRASVRARIRSGILDKDVDKALVPLSSVQNHLPMHTRNYSDFYCSLEHAKNVCLLPPLNVSVFFLL